MLRKKLQSQLHCGRILVREFSPEILSKYGFPAFPANAAKYPFQRTEMAIFVQEYSGEPGWK